MDKDKIKDIKPWDKHIAIEDVFVAIKGVIRLLPFFSWVYELYECRTDIEARRFIRQIKEFSNAIVAGNVSDAQVQEHIKMLNGNPHIMEHLNEYIDFALNGHEHEIKSKILGRLYVAFIKKEITLDEFYELSEINRRMFLGDLKMFANHLGKDLPQNKYGLVMLQRLSGFGVVVLTSFDTGNVDSDGEVTLELGNKYRVSSIGEKYLKYIKIAES